MSFLFSQLAVDELVVPPSGSEAGRRVVTAKGWNRVAQLQRERDRIGSRQAFVAMSFSPALVEVYDNGIKKGVEAAGYDPRIVRELEHTGRVDDLIIAEIRRSRFVVADFTDHRQSVYYEAGFAHGLGIPVIFTCREDQVAQAHFDTRQYTHIVWDAPERLAQRLEQRIKALIV